MDPSRRWGNRFSAPTGMGLAAPARAQPSAFPAADAPTAASAPTPTGPFNVGDRVTDDIFGTGVVKSLCSVPEYAGPGGQVLVAFDDESTADTWRTYAHLKACAPKRPATDAGIASFFVRSARLAQAARDTAGGALGGRGDSGGSGGDGSGIPDTDTADVSSSGAGLRIAGVQLASIERTRKLSQKRAAPKHGHRAGSASTNTKVPVSKRLSEFPDQSFCEDQGKLYCKACHTCVTNAAHLIKQHVGTKMHSINLAKLANRNKDDAQATDTLMAYYKQHPAESLASVPPDEQLFRLRTVESLMGTGVELAKAKGLRNILERGRLVSIGGPSHLQQYIPKVMDAELSRIKTDLLNEFISIAFDGTCRLGDAVSVTARYCTKDFEICYRLVQFITAEKHLDGASTARLLIQLLLTKLQINIWNLVAVMRDSVAANGVALRGILCTFSSATDILCLPHTLNHVGEHFELGTLESFLTPFILLVCNPGAAKLTWKQMIGEPVMCFSNVRWYSKAEIAMQIATHYHQLGPFLSKLAAEGIGEATTAKMQLIFSEREPTLRLELAAMMDMRPLVATTYEMEGDRLEVLLAYQLIEALRARGRALDHPGTLPNVNAALRATVELKPGVKVRKYWPQHGGYFDGKIVTHALDVDSTLHPGRVVKGWTVMYSDDTTEDLEEIELRSIVQVAGMAERKSIVTSLVPGFKYLEDRLEGRCAAPYNCAAELKLFRLVQAFDPMFAAETGITDEWVRELAIIQQLDDTLLTSMCAELPDYLAAAKEVRLNRADVNDFTDAVLQFWRNRVTTLPRWAYAARIVFAISCNSTSCERVFSLMTSMFGQEQLAALSDYIGGSLMLNYNNRTLG